MKPASIIPAEQIINNILLIRGQRVILDSDLATLYGVTTTRLNEQVKRNKERFPDDFMFQLTREEFTNLKSQFAISSSGEDKYKSTPNFTIRGVNIDVGVLNSLNSGWGGRRKLPYVFTEYGAIMAASVLNSQKAVEVSIFVVRAFVQLRQMLAPYKDIIKKVEQLETKLQTHDKHITAIIDAIKLLMPPPESKPKPPIGYLSEKKTHKNRRE